MRFAVLGTVTLNDWCENAGQLARHFFNSPRKRFMQQAHVYDTTFRPSLS